MRGHIGKFVAGLCVVCLAAGAMAQPQLMKICHVWTADTYTGTIRCENGQCVGAFYWTTEKSSCVDDMHNASCTQHPPVPAVIVFPATSIFVGAGLGNCGPELDQLCTANLLTPIVPPGQHPQCS